MRDSNTAHAFRIMAGIMSLMMLVVVLFSAFYIAAEADHDCCGEGCPICACIRQCENTLRGTGDSGAAQRSCVFPALFVLLIAGVSAAAAFRATPVSRKIRLNN